MRFFTTVFRFFIEGKRPHTKKRGDLYIKEMQEFFDFEIVPERTDTPFIPSDDDLSILNDFYDRAGIPPFTEPLSYEKQPQIVEVVEGVAEEIEKETAVESSTIEFIHNIIDNSNNRERVKVLPLPCGTGKTTYIQYLIRLIASKCRYVEGNIKSDFRFSDGGNGVLIITDRVKRLDDYLGSSGTVNSLVGCVTDKKVLSCTTLMTSENFQQAVVEQSHKPILLITTQRYFMMTADEINKLLVWSGGERTKIIFDESISTLNFKDINIKSLNDVDTALHDISLRAEGRDIKAEKEWVCSEWQLLTDRIKRDFSNLEDIGTERVYVWYQPNLINVSSDDERFFRFIEVHQKELGEAYKDIFDIKHLIKNGGLFEGIKKKTAVDDTEYSTNVSIIKDQKDKVVGLNASVFILDGTAVLDRRYQLDYFDILSSELYFENPKLDCSQFNREYPTLTINFVNMQSGRTYISGKNQEDRLTYFDNMRKYAESVNPEVIFTYKDCEDEFSQTENPVQTNYFGNIDGSNDYRDCTRFLQVGVNRFQPKYYLLLHFAITEFCIDKVKKMPREEQSDFINKLLNQAKTEDIDCLFRDSCDSDCLYDEIIDLLTRDLEQSIFRSKIRNRDCRDNVEYNIILNTTFYKGLIDRLKYRFPKAEINLIDTPVEFVGDKSYNRKCKEKTCYQVVRDYFESLQQGTKFTLDDMLKATGISKKKYHKAREKNKALKTLMQEHSTDVRGYFIA